MLFRLYFIIIVCLSSMSLLGKVQPLGHDKVMRFRNTESVAIQAEKDSCLTDYDTVEILSLATKWKEAPPKLEYTNEFLSQLIQGICLGYGFVNGVQSSLKPSESDRIIFQASLENAGEQLLGTSYLPTGAAVWNNAGKNHNAHAAQMAEWMKARRAGYT